MLEQSRISGAPRSYAALAEEGNVPRSTLYHRAYGRRSKEENAQSQQYLTPDEETVFARFVLLTHELGKPVGTEFMRSLAFSIARRRVPANRPEKPPGKNWPRDCEKRHPELHARKVQAIDWKRHGSNIEDKMAHWFEVMGKVPRDPDVLPGNVYNMDETDTLWSKCWLAVALDIKEAYGEAEELWRQSVQ